MALAAPLASGSILAGRKRLTKESGVTLRRIAFGAATLSAARVFQLATSFVAVPFLARILTPTDFGLVAMALSFVMFFTYIGDAGLGRSLVRVSADDRDAWSSAHWAVMALTLVLALCIIALAGPVAGFFNEPRLEGIVHVLAVAPILMGITEIPAASLLQREKFHWLAGAEFFSALAGVVVALWLAVAGAGAWALVWQHMAQRLVKMIFILLTSGFRPAIALKWDKLKEHLRFAGDTVGWSMMTFVSRQADTLIVGKFLGAATLGLYNIAVRVMQLPVAIFGQSLNSALYSRMVHLRHDKAALRELVLTATLAQSAFVFPPIAAIAASSDAFFELLLSDRWHGAGGIFTALAIAAAIQTVIGLNGTLLQAIGETGARLRLTVEFAVLWAVSALVLAQFGIHAVALGCSIVTLLYMPRLLQLYLGPIEASMLDFARALAGPALVAGVIFSVHRLIMSQMNLDSWPEVGVAVLETLIGYAVLLWFGRRTIVEKMRSVGAIFAA
jgi:O-antigen/teichoic acid export membrane protein